MTLDIGARAVDDLVRVGRLGEAQRHDRIEVEGAMVRLLSDALRRMAARAAERAPRSDPPAARKPQGKAGPAPKDPRAPQASARSTADAGCPPTVRVISQPEKLVWPAALIGRTAGRPHND